MSLHSDSGFDAFDEELARYMKVTEPENVTAILKAGADQLVEDVRRLPQPRSGVIKAGYTHLLDSVTGAEGKDNTYAVGWGKYYGPMVEKGHATVSGGHVAARSHLTPTYKANREKYAKAMQNKIEEIGGK